MSPENLIQAFVQSVQQLDEYLHLYASEIAEDGLNALATEFADALDEARNTVDRRVLEMLSTAWDDLTDEASVFVCSSDRILERLSVQGISVQPRRYPKKLVRRFAQALAVGEACRNELYK